MNHSTLPLGVTEVKIRVKLVDGAGNPQVGLSPAWSGLVFGTQLDNEAAAEYYSSDLTQIGTIAAIGTYVEPTSGTISMGEIDPTGQPGWYEFHVENARFAVAGSRRMRFLWPDQGPILGEGVAGIVNDHYSIDLLTELTQTPLIKADTESILSTLTTIAGYIDTEVAAIKAKTDNLPADPADASDIAASFSSIASTLTTIAGYIDTEVAAIKAKTDNLPSDPADASDIAGSFSTVNSTLATIASYIDTEVAAIKAKTDGLPSDPADASDIAASFSSLASTLSTIAGYIDTEVAAIKAKTDNLPASPAAVGSAMTLTSGERNAAAAAYFDLADAIETGITLRMAMRAIAAVLAGKVSGMGTNNPQFKNLNDTKVVVNATTDASSNRTAVTRDLT